MIECKKLTNFYYQCASLETYLLENGFEFHKSSHGRSIIFELYDLDLAYIIHIDTGLKQIWGWSHYKL